MELFTETIARTYVYLGADSVGNLENTATWGGFVSVKDSAGNMVNNYSANSISGANYAQPIAPPVPQLAVRKIGSEIELRWHAGFTGYALEFSENLSPNTWNIVTTAPSTEGGDTLVTLPTGETHQYFRLRN